MKVSRAMARTLDPEAHAVKRDAFVDAALRLLQSKGYERMSIQDVLDETGASKGAFYHYFGSKEALLQASIERITDAALVSVEPIVLDPDKSAVEKLLGMFSGIAGWKNARRELMLALLEVWMSDENIVVRARFQGSLRLRLGSLLSRIIAQGKDEGTFHVDEPDDVAGVVLSLIIGSNEAATRLFVDCQHGAATVEDARRLMMAFQQGLERVLAAPQGSLTYIDEEIIQTWFG
jgi:AcrR family transcriptional regulator